MNAIVPFRANDVHLNLIDASAGAPAPPPPAHKGMAYSRSEGPLKEERRPSNAFNSHAAAICTKGEAVLNREEKCEMSR